MSALIDTFYNSFSSAGPEASRLNAKHQDHWNRSANLWDEVELLKVTASHSDLERFNRNVQKLKNKWDLDIQASLVVPKSEEMKQRMIERKNAQQADVLDMLFPDKIPFLHDLLMSGEVETQFVRIEGSHDMVNAFNRLAEQMVYDKGMNVRIVVAERRKIITEAPALPSVPVTLNDLDAIMDTIYSADFSKSMPWLHQILVA
ncbi:MAG: hypothetical protein SGARI_002210 [Bacillariaceae sp.]